MPQNKSKPIGAMFDIKPVDDSGRVDFEKIDNLPPTIDLSPKDKKLNIEIEPPLISLAVSRERKPNLPPAPIASSTINLPKHEVNKQLEDLLNKNIDTYAELTGVGGQVIDSNTGRLRPKVITKNSWIDKDENVSSLKDGGIEFKAVSEIQRSAKNKPGYVIPAVSSRQESFISEPILVSETEPLPKELWQHKILVNKKTRSPVSSRRKLIFAGVIAGVVLAGWYAFHLKNELVANSNSAVQNLTSANDSIKNLDFNGAAGDFLEAYQEFSKAGDNLNFMGANIGSLLADLPGAGKLKSAQNLIETGKLLSDAGNAMSEAVASIAKTGLIADPNADSNISIGNLMTSLKKALLTSKNNLAKADTLLASVDESIIPSDKLASFDEFKSKLPAFEKLVNDGFDYSKFLEDFIGPTGSKKYLILFQNPSELRPTGGFFGSYGVIGFKDGRLSNFKVDDVYNLDGQLKQNIVPPVQIQHITPNWGMRDSNWFIDFPTSAQKAMEFYTKESGSNVDGVITISPKMISQILSIVGPIEMSKYNLTLDSNNFLTTIQDEVEYGDNRQQPKTVLVDFAPKLLEKIYSASSDQWLQIFNVIVSGLEQKDFLLYSRDLNLEGFASDKGFGGEVKQTDSDYLMATLSNIKGSKTDAVTDNSIKVETSFSDGDIIHKVTITRKHNGGDTKYGFYNKQNPAYVRMLVPDGSELISVSGNDNPNFKPLINYSNSDFVQDDDLSKLESTAYVDKSGVTRYRESGKTEFGFWMITNPGTTKTVTIEYKVPIQTTDNYEMYVQKQPGLEVKNFDFVITPPDGFKVDSANSSLNTVGGVYTISQPLTDDLPIKVGFKQN